MNREIAKAIADLSKKMNEIGFKLNSYVNTENEKMQSELDYITMVTDIEIVQSEVLEDEE